MNKSESCFDSSRRRDFCRIVQTQNGGSRKGVFELRVIVVNLITMLTYKYDQITVKWLKFNILIPRDHHRDVNNHSTLFSAEIIIWDILIKCCPIVTKFDSPFCVLNSSLHADFHEDRTTNVENMINLLFLQWNPCAPPYWMLQMVTWQKDTL